MRTYDVEVTVKVRVHLDETKFDDEFFEDFNNSITDFGTDLHQHAEHLAWVHATGVDDLSSKRAFVEGYGRIVDMGISASVIDTHTEVVSS